MSEKHPFAAQTPMQAKALLDPQTMSILRGFMPAATPSEAAQRIQQPANRVTYHVHRLLELGLLQEAEKVGKRTRYEVIAQSFSVPYRLTALSEVDETFAPFFAQLEAQFSEAIRTKAHEISEAQLEGAFTLRLGEVRPIQADPMPSAFFRYALSLNAQTLQLTAEEYRELESEIGAVMAKYAALAQAPERRPCTAVHILFPGVLFPQS